VHVTGAGTRRRPGWHDRIDPGEIVPSELDVYRLEVFLQVLPGPDSWDGDNVRSLGHQPGQRQLGRCNRLLLSHLLDLGQKLEVVLEVARLKARVVAAVIAIG